MIRHVFRRNEILEILLYRRQIFHNNSEESMQLLVKAFNNNSFQ
jgi:hypothetical protein